MSLDNPQSRTALRVRFSTPSLLAALLIFAGLGTIAHGATPFYIMSNDGVDRNNLYHISADLGTATETGEAPDGGGTITLWELVHAPGGNLYTIDRSTDLLYTLRPSDAAVLATVTLDTDIFTTLGRGFAADNSGDLFGIFNGSSLRTIDALTGITTTVTTLTGATFEALAFGSDGTLYGAGSPSGPASDRLYTIDLGTGAASLVGTFGAGLPDVDTMTFGDDGFLYGVDTTTTAGTDLYRIDPATASASLVGGLPGGVNGLVAIPEPSGTVLLLPGIGLFVMRRRYRSDCP